MGGNINDVVYDYVDYYLGSVPNEKFNAIYDQFISESLIEGRIEADAPIAVFNDGRPPVIFDAETVDAVNKKQADLKKFEDLTEDEKQSLFKGMKDEFYNEFPSKMFDGKPIQERFFFSEALAWYMEKTYPDLQPDSNEFKKVLEAEFRNFVVEPIGSTEYEKSAFEQLNEKYTSLSRDLSQMRSETSRDYLQKERYDIATSMYSKIATYMRVPDGEYSKSIDSETATDIGAVFRNLLLGEKSEYSERDMQSLISSISSSEEKAQVLKALMDMEELASNTSVHDALQEVSEIVANIPVSTGKKEGRVMDGKR